MVLFEQRGLRVTQPISFSRPDPRGGFILDLLRSHNAVQRINRFLYTPGYFFLIAVLTIFSNICGGELFTYTCFILIGIYLCLLGPDLLPLTPLVICSYIAPSTINNPGKNPNSIFSFQNGGWYLCLLAAILVVCIILRLIFDKELGGKIFLHCKRRLLSGMLVLGLTYLLSGLGSAQLIQVSWHNLLFAMLQFLSIFILYYLLTGMVRWETAPKAYLSWTGVCVGYVLLAELFNTYISNGVIVDGEIIRIRIYTGWGHYNNIGALLTMMLPAPFFLTGKGKYSGIFYLTGMAFLGGLLFTCSRASILVGVATYLASYTISLINSRNARANVFIHSFTALLVVLLFFLFHDDLLRLFRELLDRRFTSSDRDLVYAAGIQQFLDHPLFGATFYPIQYPIKNWSTSSEFIAFFPARWHNTFIQILASCGIFGLIAYCHHRFQTLRLFLSHPSSKKAFVLISIAALLATSMLDCHMFNIGPVLYYSIALAFTEKKLDIPKPDLA